VAVRADCADPFSRRALRAAAGASLRAHLIAPVDTLSELTPPLAATTPSGGQPPEEVPATAAFVLGNERDGLSDQEIEQCQYRCTIPTPGFESLNVAAAAAILIYSRA
jgi:tRNA G18 (ribose-2'-O)-methylase SpoU